MCRWPRNAYIPRMNGKLSALYRNRCSCASDCRHRATRVHICDLLPYIRLCRRSMRPYPRSARRNRLPSRCGRDRACRRGCGFCFQLGRPIVPVVIQCVHFLIGYVIAAGAGIVGAPALFRAGGGFHLVMTLQIVVVRIEYRRFQRVLRRLVAAVGTDLVIHGRRCAGGPRTSDTCRRAVPRTNGEFCSPLCYGSYRRASACRDCLDRGPSNLWLAVYLPWHSSHPARFPQLTPEQSLVSVWLWTQETGVGAVAIGATEHPFVLVRVCAAIFAIAFPAPGGVCAGWPHECRSFSSPVWPESRLQVRVWVLSPLDVRSAPVMRPASETAPHFSAGGRFGAGRYAERCHRSFRCVNHCACRRGCGRLCRWTMSTRPSRAARNRRSV